MNNKAAELKNEELKPVERKFVISFCKTRIQKPDVRGACYPGFPKGDFAREGKKFLKLVARCVGLNPEDYDLRFNPGGDAVSGDVTLHSDDVYLSFNGGEICNWLLYRSVRDRKDYCGGMNQRGEWQSIANDFDSFCNRIHGLIQDTRSRKEMKNE